MMPRLGGDEFGATKDQLLAAITNECHVNL
jgi:hypothetical protein